MRLQSHAMSLGKTIPALTETQKIWSHTAQWIASQLKHQCAILLHCDLLKSINKVEKSELAFSTFIRLWGTWFEWTHFSINRDKNEHGRRAKILGIKTSPTTCFHIQRISNRSSQSNWQQASRLHLSTHKELPYPNTVADNSQPIYIIWNTFEMCYSIKFWDAD